MKKDDSEHAANSGRALSSPPLALLAYNLFITMYGWSIKAYSLFNSKAARWVAGRRDWERRMKDAFSPGEKRIWVHCSSLGEFEQARPVLEALKEEYPGYKIVVTFFSPSGFDACKAGCGVDYKLYLPIDSARNAEKFIDALNPALSIFIKYEFWYHYLSTLRKKGIPTLLISGTFRPDQVFFKWYGGLFRDMLSCFTFFFLQDIESKKLLGTLGLDKNILISGDTRYDRVSAIAKHITPIATVEQFIDNRKILIAGSTWPADEKVLHDCLAALPDNWKLILAPHEVGAAHIKSLIKTFGQDVVLFSDLDAENTGNRKKILIINNVGMLSRLFAYGDIAFIGGGFQPSGIHNVLEPAVFGLPVIFGPVFDKYIEAKELVSLGYAIAVNDTSECKRALSRLMADTDSREATGRAARNFVLEHSGATRTIIDEIKIGRWLL